MSWSPRPKVRLGGHEAPRVLAPWPIRVRLLAQPAHGLGTLTLAAGAMATAVADRRIHGKDAPVRCSTVPRALLMPAAPRCDPPLCINAGACSCRQLTRCACRPCGPWPKGAVGGRTRRGPGQLAASVTATELGETGSPEGGIYVCWDAQSLQQEIDHLVQASKACRLPQRIEVTSFVSPC